MKNSSYLSLEKKSSPSLNLVTETLCEMTSLKSSHINGFGETGIVLTCVGQKELQESVGASLSCAHKLYGQSSMHLYVTQCYHTWTLAPPGLWPLRHLAR